MSLFSTAARFARSPQGKKAMEKAKAFATKPETKEKIEQARERLTGKKHESAAKQSGTPDAEPAGHQPAQGKPPQAP
jgi:hypothetical protein